MEKELKCPNCESSQTRFRIKTNERICYSCGYSWIQKNENIEEKEDIKE